MAEAGQSSTSGVQRATGETAPLRRAPPLERCPNCNYALAALPRRHRCPECGLAYDETTVLLYGRIARSMTSRAEAMSYCVWPVVPVVLSHVFGLFSYERALALMLLGVAALAIFWAVRRRLAAREFGGEARLWVHRDFLADQVVPHTWVKRPWSDYKRVEIAPYVTLRERLRMVRSGRASVYRWRLWRVRARPRWLARLVRPRVDLVVQSDAQSMALARQIMRVFARKSPHGNEPITSTSSNR